MSLVSQIIRAKRAILSCFFIINLLIPSQGRSEKIVGPNYPKNFFKDITDRALIAIHEGNGTVNISWRLFGNDPENISFDLYRINNEGVKTKLNNKPIVSSTYLTDKNVDTTKENIYVLTVSGNDEVIAEYNLTPQLASTPYIRIPMVPLDFDTLGLYHPNDISIGDLDGDGIPEIVVKRIGANYACSQAGLCPGGVILEAYKLTGERLWQVDLGVNIRCGAQYLQFLVYDFDGDGCAEVATKTSEGTRFGDGMIIGDTDSDGITDYVNRDSTSRMFGKILEGPEFFSILDGKTGVELARGPYIERGNVEDWGDNYGNRVDRQLGAVGYFDGETPGIFWGRGYNGKSVMHVWTFKDRILKREWIFDTSANPDYKSYENQGNHNIRIGDVDGDGKDEVIYGACAINNDGTPLHNTRLGHGDAMHLLDIDPDNPGLEIWQGHEYVPCPAGSSLRDAVTGEILVGIPSKDDVGRAMCSDIDPRFPGCEIWTTESEGVLSCKGEVIYPKTPSINMAIWWDGDLTRELQDGIMIDKWNGHGVTNLFNGKDKGIASNNGTKANPCLIADIFGDWREEIIWRSEDNSEIRIYMTPFSTAYRFPSFMEDPIYRWGVISQNVGYNQPNHTGFYFGPDKDTVMENEFRLLENQNWKKAYAEKEGQKSEKNWYIDGEKGSMKKDGNKIILEAGPDIESEDDHIVMWSKKSFKGDIMIDYEFTKLDSLERFVNIIYIQATGNNAPESPKDISKWKEKRKTPLMSHYYNNMNLTHLSYAAFENKPDIRNTEYIRARRYMPDAGNGLKGTEFPEEYLCPLLFETGIKHKLTIIKQDGNILFRVKTGNRTAYYKFTGDSLPDYEEGAIGFRQMHGRNSSYENIVVYTKND